MHFDPKVQTHSIAKVPNWGTTYRIPTEEDESLFRGDSLVK